MVRRRKRKKLVVSVAPVGRRGAAVGGSKRGNALFSNFEVKNIAWGAAD